jgi:hypothetical protein
MELSMELANANEHVYQLKLQAYRIAFLDFNLPLYLLKWELTQRQHVQHHQPSNSITKSNML